MSQPITDRQLERLALGELEEAEAEALLAKLEERGELHRFEAILADDEAFLDAHPPALLAAQVREEVRRRARTRNPQEKTMLKPAGHPIAFGLAVLAFTALVVALFSLLGPEPPRPAPVAPEEVAAPTPAPAPVVGDPDGVNIKDYDDVFPLPSTFYAAAGDIIRIPAKGITNVQIGMTRVASVTETGGYLYVEAKAPGNTIVSFGRERGGKNSRTMMLIVGEPLDAGELRVAAEPSLSSCGTREDGVVTLRIVAQYHTVFVGHAHAGGAPLRPELRACIDRVVGDWEIAEVDRDWKPSPEVPGRPVGVEKLSVGTLRFNFAAGAVCEPGEDC